MPENGSYRSKVVEGWVSQAPLVAPEFYRCAPDDASEMGRLQDDYFQRVVELLGYNDRAIIHFLNIKPQIMAFEDASGIYPTNNGLTLLTAQDELIAFTLEKRTNYNFVDFSLVCTLNQEVLDILRANPALLKQPGSE